MIDENAIKKTLKEHSQEHLLRYEAELTPEAREQLYEQLADLEFPQLEKLVAQAKQPTVDLVYDKIEPIAVVELPRTAADRQRWQQAEEVGLEALRAGRVGVVLVAGGQGSRLGFPHPKGMYPIGPVNRTSLFQIFAETILEWRRQLGRAIPWYIMTSPGNRADTIDFFAGNGYFGLPAEDVKFFVQGDMPAVDAQTGKVLLADKGKVFTSPNGHGGTLAAMRKDGVLDDAKRRGVDLFYYFQVDNVFVKILEPAFIGFHLQAGAQVSAKVVRKVDPVEKVGLVVNYEGRPTVIEYSDLPESLGRLRDDNDTGLKFWPGSIAIHVFDRAFLDRVTSAEVDFPFHIARKKVPHLDEDGRHIEPTKPNALKFEMFIFDVMPLAEKVAIVETDRHEEFMPVKNADGDDSPAVVRAAMCKRAAQWLAAAGVNIPVDGMGNPPFALEISPLAGLSPEQFAKSLTPMERQVTGPRYFAGKR